MQIWDGLRNGIPICHQNFQQIFKDALFVSEVGRLSEALD